jgi:puromycin-sensitive aminopeptidase
MAHPTDDRSYRLPRHLLATSYDAALSLDLEAKAFSGTMRVALALERPSDEIVLHAAALEVSYARAHAAGGEIAPVEIRAAPASETILLRFGAPLPAGALSLDLRWSGKMTEGLRGLYPAGAGIAATQFEAADARRVFPCLDEPGFKATWRLAVEAPKGVAILSNGAPEREEDLGARRRVHFATTPPLPTYLVALVVGGLDAHPPVTVRRIPVRTFAQPEKLPLTGFGQDVAVEVLPRLEDYFGVPYAFGKLDQVGLPEFEAGAMENAGLVTYREVALLLDPATASLAQKKRVAEVVTHELAHQWFGNWVTMTWWDDLWLNEAFATWMAFKIVDAWNPGWRVWLEFDQGKAAAMHLDALRSTHPIRADIHNVAEAGEAFDLITYEKGGAVLRMIEGYLGEAPFREGIRLYMRRHARGNAVADDLWAALGEASREPVLELANAWIRQPGFPVVHVARVGRVLRLEQRRFFSDPAQAKEGDATLWPVPLVVRYGDGDAVTEQRFLLRERSAEVPLAGEGDPSFVFANGGATGFYRVAYDAVGLAALVRNVPRLATSERIALLSDEWALVRAGERDVGAFLDLCVGFAGEEEYAVLDELVGRLAAIEHRLVAEADRPALQRFVAGLFGPQLAATSWDAAPGEPDAVRLRRSAAVRALGLVAREPAALAEATGRLDRWLAGERRALEPNLHDVAVTVTARAGDAARFEAFRALFAKETDPAFRRRYLLALASFEAPALAARGVELALSDEVPLQDSASFVGALLANRATREPGWARVRDGWDRLHARLAAAPMLLRRVVEAMGSLVERRHLEEAEAFLAAHPLEEARQAIAQTLERLRQDVELRERTQGAIGRWLAAR